MIKQIIFVLLISLIFAQDLCPSKLIAECEKDAELGNRSLIQLINHVTRLPRRREPTRLPTSTASSSFSVPRRTAGPASARSPKRKDGRSRDALSWSASSKPSPKTSRRIDPISSIIHYPIHLHLHSAHYPHFYQLISLIYH